MKKDGGRPPWHGDERERFIADAARRAYVGGGFPDLTELSDLLLEPRPPSIYASPDEIDATDGTELHAIGVYEARRPNDARTRSRGSPSVDVIVGPTPRRVDLFLMSAAPLLWRIKRSKGARLGRIWLSGARGSSVAPRWLSLKASRIDHGPTAWSFEGSADSDGPSERHLLAAIESRAGRDVASFQGGYSADGFRVPFYREPLILQEILRRCRDLGRSRTTTLPVPTWIVEGRALTQLGGSARPIPLDLAAPRAVTPCEIDGRFYVIDDQRLYAVSSEGVPERIEAPPEVSWLGGVTYDSRRRRVVVSTHWHTGYHHVFDPKTSSWEAIPIGRAGGAYASIAYEPSRDVIYGLQADTLVYAMEGRAEILVLSPDLKPAGRVVHRDPLPIPAGAAGPTWDVQLTAFADALALLVGATDERGMSSRHSDGGLRIERGFLVRLDRDEIQPLDLGARGLAMAAVASSGRPDPPRR